MTNFDGKDHIDKVKETEKIEENKEKSIEKEEKKKQAYNFDKYNEQFEERKQEEMEVVHDEGDQRINFDKYQKQLNKDIAEQQNEQAEINPDVDSAEVMEAQKVEKENIEAKKRLENIEENAEEIKKAKKTLEETDGEKRIDPAEENGEKNREQVEETPKEEETGEGKKLDQLEEPTEEAGGKTPEQVEKTPKEEETVEGKKLDQLGEPTEEEVEKTSEQVEETVEGKKLDQLEEPTEEVGETTPEQVEEPPKEEETVEGKKLDQLGEPTEEVEKTSEQVEETVEGKKLDQLEEPTEEVGETTPEQVEEPPKEEETGEGKKLDQLEEPTEEVGEKNPDEVEETPKKEETEEDKALDQSEEPLEQEVQEDENPSETRENLEEMEEGTDSSEGSREETVKKEFEPRSETEEESGFDLDKLFDQKKKEIDQRTIGQILKERKDAWREAGYGDSFKEMWKNAIQAQVDAAKEGRLWEYNKEEFRKEIKHVYEDGMKLANKVIENNKILGPIKEVLEERNKKWNEAGEGKYTLKSSIEAQIEAAKQGPKAWWEYNKKEFRKEIKTAYEDCAKMADKITDNYQTLKNIKVSLEERHQKRIEDGEGATLLEMCKNSVRAQIDAAKEGRLWEYNKEEFRKEIKNVYEDGVKIADKITDTYKVIANAKVSLRERHEKRIEDGEGATLLEMCKNSVKAQIDAAKEGRWLKYNKEEFSKEIKNVYEDSMKVANKMIEGNKILFSIKEVAIEREKIWSESGDEKYTLKGSMKAQIEAIKQGPAEWFKYNKEEFSREIKTVYEDSMKVANKIIDKYKPLADARDILEARDKKWREAGEANTIISSFKAQLELAKKSPRAWWDYNIKSIQRETRHLFEDGRMYLIKYMDTPGLFDEVDDKASEKKDDKKRLEK
ncbi:hypothetical protein [Bacillus pacificus]|uniref:hypothetical protein n=1 Tax=Bacillus pacificus TaxID=2026187 RepID=UPI002E202B5E|nr:hypothetical protein [Bacillus pacificus]